MLCNKKEVLLLSLLIVCTSQLFLGEQREPWTSNGATPLVDFSHTPTVGTLACVVKIFAIEFAVALAATLLTTFEHIRCQRGERTSNQINWSWPRQPRDADVVRVPPAPAYSSETHSGMSPLDWSPQAAQTHTEWETERRGEERRRDSGSSSYLGQRSIRSTAYGLPALSSGSNHRGLM